MKQAIKNILRAIGEQPTPEITAERYTEFFRHPCWLALRQHCAKLLDQATDDAFTAPDINAINKARGVMDGLMFIMDSEENLKVIITDNEDAINASPSIERRIAGLLEMLAEEHKETS